MTDDQRYKLTMIIAEVAGIIIMASVFYICGLLIIDMVRAFKCEV